MPAWPHFTPSARQPTRRPEPRLGGAGMTSNCCRAATCPPHNHKLRWTKCVICIACIASRALPRSTGSIMNAAPAACSEAFDKHPSAHGQGEHSNWRSCACIIYRDSAGPAIEHWRRGFLHIVLGQGQARIESSNVAWRTESLR
eukprot:SM001506S01458  [mRNA]  locus=s1506:433:1115:+ [translate_table: standard]